MNSYYVFQIFRKIICKFKKLSYNNKVIKYSDIFAFDVNNFINYKKISCLNSDIYEIYNIHFHFYKIINNCILNYHKKVESKCASASSKRKNFLSISSELHDFSMETFLLI